MQPEHIIEDPTSSTRLIKSPRYHSTTTGYVSSKGKQTDDRHLIRLLVLDAHEGFLIENDVFCSTIAPDPWLDITILDPELPVIVWVIKVDVGRLCERVGAWLEGQDAGAVMWPHVLIVLAECNSLLRLVRLFRECFAIREGSH
jgi:hypothetical protein